MSLLRRVAGGLAVGIGDGLIGMAEQRKQETLAAMRAGELRADREMRAAESQKDRDFRAGESEKDRAFRAEQSALARAKTGGGGGGGGVGALETDAEGFAVRVRGTQIEYVTDAEGNRVKLGGRGGDRGGDSEMAARKAWIDTYADYRKADTLGDDEEIRARVSRDLGYSIDDLNMAAQKRAGDRALPEESKPAPMREPGAPSLPVSANDGTSGLSGLGVPLDDNPRPARTAGPGTSGASARSAPQGEIPRASSPADVARLRAQGYTQFIGPDGKVRMIPGA